MDIEITGEQTIGIVDTIQLVDTPPPGITIINGDIISQVSNPKII